MKRKTMKRTTRKTLDDFAIGRGAHYDGDGAAGCVMELQSYLAGEPWSAHPECTHDSIAAFARVINDAMDDKTRERLLRPVLRDGVLGGTAGGDSRRLAYHFADAAVRRFAPQALRAAGLIGEAECLESLPPAAAESAESAARAAESAAEWAARAARAASAAAELAALAAVRESVRAARAAAMAAKSAALWDESVAVLREACEIARGDH